MVVYNLGCVEWGSEGCHKRLEIKLLWIFKNHDAAYEYAYDTASNQVFTHATSFIHEVLIALLRESPSAACRVRAKRLPMSL